MKTLATDRRKRYLGRRIMTDDAECCCGGGCTGATSCCGPSTCGLRALSDPIILEDFTISGTATLNVSTTDKTAVPPVTQLESYTFDFSPVRVPPTWTDAPGLPPNNCGRSLTAPTVTWFPPGVLRQDNEMNWAANLTLAVPNHVRLNFIQTVSGTLPPPGFPEPNPRGTFIFSLFGGPSPSMTMRATNASARGSGAIPLTVLEFYTNGTCVHGGEFLGISAGSDSFENSFFRILWNWNIAVDIVARWNLCSCTGGSSPGCTDCGQDGGL